MSNSNNAAFAVSAIIVHVGSIDLLKGCLESLNGSSVIEQIETIVVDNASGTPGLEELIAVYPNTRIVRLENRRGYPAATNAGIRVSKGRYILWCNDDLIFAPDTVERLLNYLETHPEYGAAGPRLLNPDGSFQPSFSMIHIGPRSMLIQYLGLASLFPQWSPHLHWRGHELVEQDVAVVTGACCLIRREALEQIGGGIDERFYLYCEEVDLCLSLWKSGWRVRYLPGARITHLRGQSIVRTLKAHIPQIQLLRSDFAYLRKHYGSGTESIVAAAFILGTCLRLARTWLLQTWACLQRRKEHCNSYRETLQLYTYLIQVSLGSGRHEADELPELARSPW